LKEFVQNKAKNLICPQYGVLDKSRDAPVKRKKPDRRQRRILGVWTMPKRAVYILLPAEKNDFI